MPYNFVADGFDTRRFCSRLFFRQKCNFGRKTAILHFWAPSPLCGEGVKGNIRCSS